MSVIIKASPSDCGSGRRQAILATALQLFTKLGYFNTSVHDIQRQAGVSIGSIYHHFKNKEAIAKALFDSMVEEMSRKMEEIRVTYSTAHDRCRAVIAYLFDLTEKSPSVMQYVLYAKHREFMPDEKPICSSRPFEMMKKMVVEGIEQGDIRGMEPIVAATSVFGGAIRLIYLRLDGALEEPLPALLDEIWECAWRAVKDS